MLSDNSSCQWQIPSDNGNNEVQSTTSAPEVEAESLPEATVLAQVAQRCSAKYVRIFILF